MESGESTLRAKYLDWCSARLAERFLDLSPEEIYALARPESSPGEEAGEAAPGEATPGESGPPGVNPPTPPDAAAAPDAAADSAADSDAAVPRLPDPTEDGYRVLVQRVTEALLKRTSLPTFEQWAEAYREDPERFDAELLGFWKDVVGED